MSFEPIPFRLEDDSFVYGLNVTPNTIAFYDIKSKLIRFSTQFEFTDIEPFNKQEALDSYHKYNLSSFPQPGTGVVNKLEDNKSGINDTIILRNKSLTDLVLEFQQVTKKGDKIKKVECGTLDSDSTLENYVLLPKQNIEVLSKHYSSGGVILLR